MRARAASAAIPTATAVRATIVVTLAGIAFAAGAAGAGDSGYVVADDGVRLFYRSCGEGRRLVLVPLVGWNFEEFERRAGGTRFVFYDPRGRGGSDEVDPAGLGLERDLADLDAVRRHFGAKRVALIGTSYYGGLVALYAARYPERVSRIVMVGPISTRKSELLAYDPPERAARITDDDRTRLAELKAGAVDPREYCREYWRVHRKQLVGDPTRASDVDLAERCELPNEWPENFDRWVVGLLGALGEWDWTADAGGVRAPALIVQGARDLTVPPAGARVWAGAMPRARLLVLEQGGHVPWVGSPEEIFPAVLRFLGGRWPAAARKPPFDRSRDAPGY